MINAQSASVVDVSSFAQVLTDNGITGTLGEYTIMTENTTTIRSLDSAVTIVVSGPVSALDNEKFAESTKTTFESTVAADIGKVQPKCFINEDEHSPCMWT